MKAKIINILIMFSPFFIFFIGIFIFKFILTLPNWIIDDDLGSRNVILGLYIFAALIIMSNLIHFQMYISDNKLHIHYQLSHRFSADRDKHELKFGSKFICTGCFGSFLGILIGLILLVLYVILNIEINFNFGLILFGLGSIFVLFGYFRYIFEFSPKYRIIQHFSLFLGIFFILISIDISYRSFYMLIISFPIVLSFIGARLMLAMLNEDIKEND